MTAAVTIAPPPGQIWFLERPRLGNAAHGHSVLITQVRPSEGTVTINFIATASTSHNDLLLRHDLDGFESLGLKHDSYLLVEHAYDLGTDRFLAHGTYKGRLTGEVKKLVEDWWGESL